MSDKVKSIEEINNGISINIQLEQARATLLRMTRTTLPYFFQEVYPLSYHVAPSPSAKLGPNEQHQLIQRVLVGNLPCLQALCRIFSSAGNVRPMEGAAGLGQK